MFVSFVTDAPSEDAPFTSSMRSNLPSTQKKPLRGILKKQGQPRRTIGHVEVSSGFEVQHAQETRESLQRLLSKLEKQIALQKKISVLFAEQMSDTVTGKKPSIDAESYRAVMDNIKRSQDLQLEMQSKLLLCCSSC